MNDIGEPRVPTPESCVSQTRFRVEVRFVPQDEHNLQENETERQGSDRDVPPHFNTEPLLSEHEAPAGWLQLAGGRLVTKPPLPEETGGHMVLTFV